MFMKNIPFLITIYSSIKFVTIEYVHTCKAKKMIKYLKGLWKYNLEVSW